MASDKLQDSAPIKGRFSLMALGALAGSVLGGVIFLIMEVAVDWYLNKVDPSAEVLFGILMAVVLGVGTFPLQLLVHGWHPEWALPANLALWGALFGLYVHRQMRLANRAGRAFSLSPTDESGDLKGFAYFWAAAPLIAGLPGALIGCAYGAAAMGINVRILVSTRSTRYKYVTTSLVFVATAVAYFVTILIYQALFHAQGKR